VALEKAGTITTVLFDKTGTLTIGRPAVIGLELLSAEPENEVKRVAAALARASRHPLSQAVARMGEGDLQWVDWLELRGAGVQARLPLRRGSNLGAHPQLPDLRPEYTTYRLGSLKWLHEMGIPGADGTPRVLEWYAEGATVLGFARGQTLIALLGIKDTIKPRAPEVIRMLRRQGLNTSLVTGDNPRTAASIAAQTGIPSAQVFAEVRPEQKAELVRRLQAQGQKVAFVGDGINDAPALEQADLGIAVARASDVAREAADMILLKSEIEAVPESLGLARATLRTIKQNLFWAFFYNAAGIPLAALGFMSPVLCAAAMALSDLVVIGNALRLSGWRLKA
jgi:Cu+-exporting ATPase